MIKIYKNTSLEKIEKIDSIEKNCWIDLVSPTIEEIDLVVEKTNIDKNLILKLLDEEEIPRIEFEGNSTLIVVDCPYIEGKNNRYSTLPMGIIISSDNYFLTISSKKQEVLKLIRSNKVKNVQISMKSRLLIQILYQNAKLYLKYLKMINNNIDKSEKKLYNSTENNELISVLNIEKSLVYFITSLKENDILIEKIFKGNVIEMYEDDLDLLEDAQIENKQGIEMANIYREILSSVSDAYATIISNNLNQAMKILTSITIIFSVPTMIASFMGMNVKLGKLSVMNSAFSLIMIFSLVLSLILAIYLKRKKLL